MDGVWRKKRSAMESMTVETEPMNKIAGAALISSHVKMVIVYPNESDVMELSNVVMGVMRKIAAAALFVKMESVWSCSWFAMVTMTVGIIVTK
jgi:hypothetical protein